MPTAPRTRKGRDPVAARLFFIVARKSPAAVIFRRGPSKWVQLIRWNTDTDTFEPGQWFHGRIYERRCDLSPDGSLLIYFAQKISARTLKDYEYTYAWTAISKPPYLTALALWKADCGNGGGSFDSNRQLQLNHGPGAVPHPKHKPPQWLHISPKATAPGGDDLIFSEHLERDGWSLKQEWKMENRGHPRYFHTIQPEIRAKASRNQEQMLRLTRSIERFESTDEFSVMSRSHPHSASITGASWADWDRKGRLIFARAGKVYTGRLDIAGLWSEKELADFNSSKPEPLASPPDAKKW